jgi:hypothetical protein
METTGGPGSPFRDPDDPKFKQPGVRPPPLPSGPPPPPPAGYHSPQEGYRLPFQLDIGRVLSQTFSTYFRNLHWFLLLGLVVYSPLFICGGLFYSRPLDVMSSKYFVYFGWFVMAADKLLLHNILAAALVWWVVEHLRGGKVSVGACLRASLTRLLPVLALALLTFVIYLLGFVALVVPMIVFMCMFYVAIPALMVERIGPIQALKRSRELTSGTRWYVLFILFIIAVLSTMFAGVIVLPVTIAAKGQLDPAVSFWLTQGLGLFTKTLAAVVPAVVYQEYRVLKEGGDVESLVAVFE